MRFVEREEAARRFAGKRVAVVGSGPGCATNWPGFIDGHDVVVRVNNHKTGQSQGYRTDVHFSFYGSSIKKTADELKAEGVTLCIAKCPNAKFLESDWHRLNHKPHGVDFRYIYRQRAGWWFTDTYIPAQDEFMASFELLDRHIPTTGFSALLFVLSAGPASCYLTGMDFFSTRIHNVDEPWKPGRADDPIGHVPERERAWLAANLDKHPIALDGVLSEIMRP